jgi:cobalamin biosynthesis protein CobT
MANIMNKFLCDLAQPIGELAIWLEEMHNIPATETVQKWNDLTGMVITLDENIVTCKPTEDQKVCIVAKLKKISKAKKAKAEKIPKIKRDGCPYVMKAGARMGIQCGIVPKNKEETFCSTHRKSSPKKPAAKTVAPNKILSKEFISDSEDEETTKAIKKATKAVKTTKAKKATKAVKTTKATKKSTKGDSEDELTTTKADELTTTKADDSDDELTTKIAKKVPEHTSSTESESDEGNHNKSESDEGNHNKSESDEGNHNKSESDEGNHNKSESDEGNHNSTESDSAKSTGSVKKSTGSVKKSKGSVKKSKGVREGLRSSKKVEKVLSSDEDDIPIRRRK